MSRLNGFDPLRNAIEAFSTDLSFEFEGSDLEESEFEEGELEGSELFGSELEDEGRFARRSAWKGSRAPGGFARGPRVAGKRMAGKGSGKSKWGWGSPQKKRRRPRRRPWIFGLPVTGWPVLPWSPPPPPPPSLAEPAEPAAPEEEPTDDASVEEPDAGSPVEAAPEEQETAFEEQEAWYHGLKTSISAWVSHIVRLGAPDVPTSGGVYIVESADGKPLYVGETNNFKRLWRERLRDAYRAGLLEASQAGPKVWFGTITDKSGLKYRKTIEHATIRTLTRGGLGSALRNDRSKEQFLAMGEIRISNLLPSHWASGVTGVTEFSGNVLTLAAGQKFEIAPPRRCPLCG